MKELIRSLLVFVVMSILTGLMYPFIITGLSRLEFEREAKGSLIVSRGKIAGSSLIGQEFAGARYFHGRPSALEKPYDASNSGGSNFGPSNGKFLEEVGKRVQKVRKENRLTLSAPVPADLVLASASGLDPHVSPEAAMIQVGRVANARGLSEPAVVGLVRSHLEGLQFGLLGRERVNVLLLNRALDDLGRKEGQDGGSR
jgi:K+-transporting ATPase ATPase C chain